MDLGKRFLRISGVTRRSVTGDAVRGPGPQRRKTAFGNPTWHFAPYASSMVGWRWWSNPGMGRVRPPAAPFATLLLPRSYAPTGHHPSVSPPFSLPTAPSSAIIHRREALRGTAGSREKQVAALGRLGKCGDGRNGSERRENLRNRGENRIAEGSNRWLSPVYIIT